MSGLAVKVRQAKPDDAEGIARGYIESWHDTYAAIHAVAVRYDAARSGRALARGGSGA